MSRSGGNACKALSCLASGCRARQIVGIDHLGLAGLGGIAHVDVEHEAIQLRFRQWIGALEFARVLRGDHQEVVRQVEGLPVHGDLPLFQRFQQCRLRLRPGAVDFVHQQHVGEYRTRLEGELASARIEDVNAGDVGGHQIGGALHALEVAVQHLGQRLAEQRLANAGRSLQQHMAAADQGDANLMDGIESAEQNAAQLRLQVAFQILCVPSHVASLVVFPPSCRKRFRKRRKSTR